MPVISGAWKTEIDALGADTTENDAVLHIKEIKYLLWVIRLGSIYNWMETVLKATPYRDKKGDNGTSSDRAHGFIQPSRVPVLLCANATGSDKSKFSAMYAYFTKFSRSVVVFFV